MKSLIITIIVTLFFFSAGAQNISHKHLNTKKNVAIEGYDPVSYFIDGPKEGKPDINSSHNEVIYRFSSEANKKEFDSNPTKYVPEYGGWCAYAIGATADKVKIDPKTYKIKDGKLLLFYNFRGTNTLTLWNESEKDLFIKANSNWSEIIKN